jgi:hypothetical protein
VMCSKDRETPNVLVSGRLLLAGPFHPESDDGASFYRGTKYGSRSSVGPLAKIHE